MINFKNLSSRTLWSAYGAMFGVAFPIMAGAIRASQLGLAGAIDAAKGDPLLWIIATAPLFLGAFAWLGGYQNDKVKNFSKNLEKMVEEKTMEVTASNKAIKLVLDHVSFGLLICDESLRIKTGYSKACLSLLDLNEATKLDGRKLSDVLNMSPREAAHFEAIYFQIFDADFLLGDLSVDYLPTRFKIKDRSIGLTGSVVHDEDGRSNGVLFCLADVSSLVQAEREISENRSLIKMISNIESFKQFLVDSRKGLAQLLTEVVKSDTNRNDSLIKRELHTLKGNVSIYGLNQVAEVVHHVEEQPNIASSHIREIEQKLNEFLNRHESVVGSHIRNLDEETVVIPISVVKRVESSLQSADPKAWPDLFVDFMQMIRKKPVKEILGPIEESFSQVAERLGKTASLKLVGRDVLVPQHLQGVFKVLIHLVRNALDHGIEFASERHEKGPSGQVVLDVRYDTDDKLIIIISDDGRGLDKHLIAKKALAKGFISNQDMESLPDSEIYKLIFKSGFSTATNVTEISGRGVGLDAVWNAVVSVGGSVDVSSEAGHGTSFRIDLPVNDLGVGSKLAA